MKKILVLWTLLLSLALGVQSFAHLKEEELEKILDPIMKEYENGSKKKAISMLKEKTEKYPEEVQLSVFLGLLYDQDGSPEEAQKEFARAMEVSKKNPFIFEGEEIDIKNLIASNYFSAEEYEKALKWYKEYEKENMDNTLLQYIIAVVNTRLGNLEEAKRYYLKAEKEDNTGLAAIGLGYLYDELEGNQKEGLKWYVKAAEKGNLTAFANLGIFYIEMEDYRKAENWIKKGIAEAGKQPDAYDDLKNMEEMLRDIQSHLK